MNNNDLIRKVINFLKFPEMYMYFRKRIVNKHIIIFAYHRIYPGKDNIFVKNIYPEEFGKQIKYLKGNFKIYSFEKLINLLSSNKMDNGTKENIAVITFDDGYKDNYVYAYPILKKYQVPATIFLVSGCIGKDELFWWDKIGYIISNSQKSSINIPNFGDFSLIDNQKKFHCIFFLLSKFKKFSNQLKNKYIINLQKICGVTIPPGLGEKTILSWGEIREMKDNGISFGSHTLNHPNLANIDLNEAEKEIIHSKKMIKERLKTDITLFAYPHGSKSDYNSEIIELIKNTGFKCACTSHQKLVNKYDIEDIYNLPRIQVSNNFDRFKIEISGILSDFNYIFRTSK